MKKLLVSLALFCTIISLSAQWSQDASTPNAIAAFNAEQVIPKVAISSDGYCYVCRFDNSGGGYHVYLQYFTPSGLAVWDQPAGILVSANPSMTWLTDYDMDIDQSGNAVIVWQDIRNAGVNNVYIYKVTPEGQLLWFPDGIALSNDSNTEFSNMSPTVFNAGDNSAYVAWQRMQSTASIKLHRISPTGQKLWGEEGITLSPASGSYTWPQIIQGDGDNVLLKYYYDSGPFWAPTRHVYVAKFNPEGVMQWNTALSTAGGISAWQQIIAFEEDGQGGAVVAWYDDRDSNNINDIYIQRVDASGQISMGQNGTLISLNGGAHQFYPKLSVDPLSQRIFAFWKETDASQNNSGVYRQLLDFSGNRLWGDNGEIIQAVGPYPCSPVAAYQTAWGAVCLYEISSQASSDQSLTLKAVCFRASGMSAWDPQTVDLALNPSMKYHYDCAQNRDDWAVLTWEQGSSNMDIYAMRINRDGSLGMQYLPPTDFIAELSPPHTVNLQWQHPSPYWYPLSYQVFMNDELAQTVNGNSNSYSLDLSTPGNYEFKVRAAYDDGYYSPFSDPASVLIVSADDPLALEMVPVLSVYPNPVRNTAILRLEDIKSGMTARLEVFNLRGQAILSREVRLVSGYNELNLSAGDLSSFPSGVYQIRLKGPSVSIRSRFIVIK